MKTVKDSCILNKHALNINVSDSIAQLEQVILDLEQGQEFFERTHITEGLRKLMNEGLARLSGRSSQAIFHLKQAMGGGKTHLLIALGLLASHPELRKKYCPDLHQRFLFGNARVAFFNGCNRPKEYFWGDIAKQLGKADKLREFWINGLEAPDQKAWLSLFEGSEPTLILLDELPPYFHYYLTKEAGKQTQADIIANGFSNLLRAASLKSNVCVIISDLSVAYEAGSRIINKSLDDVRQEVGRQEKTITPVDLASNEIYEILKKNLFEKLPNHAEIENIAAAYSKALSEATRSQSVGRSAESIADEIVCTYPFHPRLKNLIALFKENEKFRQTRGLMELISRLLKSVWESQSNDVFLIGAQHFDLGIPDVKDAFEHISNLRSAITNDIWDENQAAHAQIIDTNAGNACAKQVATLVLTSSLSASPNALKGLTKQEVLECLITPLAEGSSYSGALEKLYSRAWYLHVSNDGLYYFDPRENLGKKLKAWAEDAPASQIDKLKAEKLQEFFQPKSNVAYQKVLALPTIDQIENAVRQQRTLVIFEPDGSVPPEKIEQFFQGLTQKNNLIVLTSDQPGMHSLENAARLLFAILKAERQLDENTLSTSEFKHRKEEAEHGFLSTVLALFNQVLRPVMHQGIPKLRGDTVQWSKRTEQGFDGEKQIEIILSGDRVGKLILDTEGQFPTIIAKAESLLWHPGEDRARWTDIVNLSMENPQFFWLPPKGLESLKKIAVEKGKWEDEGNGWVNKKPAKKKASVQVTQIGEISDEGKVRIRVLPINGGPSPIIFKSPNGIFDHSTEQLTVQEFETDTLRLYFQTKDPTHQYESDKPQEWVNKLKIVCASEELQGDKRLVELKVLPKGEIQYTLDGSNPRNGMKANGPFDIGLEKVRIIAFAECEGIEVQENFDFRATNEKNQKPSLDPKLPARLKKALTWDSRKDVWNAIEAAIEYKAKCFDVKTLIGEFTQYLELRSGSELPICPSFLQNSLNIIQAPLDPSTPLKLTIKSLQFPSGIDLELFAQKTGIDFTHSEVTQ